MANEEKKTDEDEICAKLKKQVDAIIAKFQTDMECIRYPDRSDHILDGIRDDVFDEVEKIFVNTVRQGKPLTQGDNAYDAIGDIGWETVEFIEAIRGARLKLDNLVKKRCEELVKGNACARWIKKKRAGVGGNATGGQSE